MKIKYQDFVSVHLTWLVGLVLIAHVILKPYLIYGTVIGLPYSSFVFSYLGWILLPFVLTLFYQRRTSLNGQYANVYYGGLFSFAAFSVALPLMLFWNLYLGPAAEVDGNDVARRYWVTVLLTDLLLFIYGVMWAGRIKIKILLLFWCAAFLIAHLANEPFREALTEGAERLGTAAHQFADIVGLIGLSLAVAVSQKWKSYLIYVLTILLVLSINSRATVLSLLIVFPFFSYFRFGMRGIVLSFLFFGFIGISIIAIPERILAWFDENVILRLAALFVGASDDGSFSERTTALIVGLEQLFDSPLVGSFRGDYIYFGAEGLYIHGLLELPRQLGLLVFLPYLFVIAFSAKALLLLNNNDKIDKNIFLILFLGFIYCLIEFIFARAPGYQLMAVVMGSILGALSQANRKVV